MPCVGRYASAEDFVGFFCVESRLSRVHTGANGAAVLTDSMAHFVNKGVLAGEGMIVYNITDGSQGAVTAVTDVTITAVLTGGTGNVWDTGDVYLIVTVDAFERATIEHYLDVTASDLHAALAAQGMCNCALSAWGLEFLKKLNIIDAASFYSCGCAGPKLTDEVRRQYREWMTAQLDNIRTGKLDLCDNVTGAEFPAFGQIKENVTDFAAAQIIADRIAKGIP